MRKNAIPKLKIRLASAPEMMEWVHDIIGFGIRRPGCRQSLEVEHWLERMLRDFGLEAVRREEVPVNCWEPAAVSLTMSNSVVPCFPVPYTAWTNSKGLEAPMTFLTQGSSEDFLHAELQGRIAVLEARFAQLSGSALKRGAFFIRDGKNSIPDGPMHVANWLITNFSACYEAEARGAAGMLGLLVDSPIDGCEFYVPYDGHLKGLPALWVGREHVARVRSMAQSGQTARLLSTGETRVVDSHNIVGIVPGTGRGVSGENENIIVTCHHDAPFASAVEDASGLSVLLALARHFSATSRPLQRDLVFIASSGHFHGGIGNRVFVEKHADGLLRRTVAAFGVEHIAEEAEPDGQGSYRLTGRAEVRALFFDGSPKFARVLEHEASRQQLDRMICTDAYSFGSEPPCDSAPFFTAGIPSACHISGPLYLFDPQDTADKVRTADLVPVAQFFASAIRQVDGLASSELSEGMKHPRGSAPTQPPPWFRPPPKKPG